MRREFPGGGVDLADVPEDLDLASMTRDFGDAHVCALAIAGSADLLFTFDRGYLKEPLRDHVSKCPTSTASSLSDARSSRRPSLG